MDDTMGSDEIISAIDELTKAIQDLGLGNPESGIYDNDAKYLRRDVKDLGAAVKAYGQAVEALLNPPPSTDAVLSLKEVKEGWAAFLEDWQKEPTGDKDAAWMDWLTGWFGEGLGDLPSDGVEEENTVAQIAMAAEARSRKKASIAKVLREAGLT